MQTSDPELHGELMRGVQQTAFSGKENEAKRAAMIKELTAANESATGKNKLTPQQIEGRVNDSMFKEISGGGINAVLSAGTAEVRKKLSIIGARAGQEVLDGKLNCAMGGTSRWLKSPSILRIEKVLILF